MLDNQLFHIHDSWDLDPIKARSNPFGRMFNTTQTACIRKNLINNYMKKKKSKKKICILPFLSSALFLTLDYCGIETSTSHAWLKFSLLLLFFLLVVPVGAAHLCHNKLTWDQPSPYGHYQGINLGGYPDLWTLWRLETEQKAHTTSHCPTDHQRMSKNRYCPQTTTHRLICVSSKT